MLEQGLRILSINPGDYFGSFLRALISFFITSLVFFKLQNVSYIPSFLNNKYIPISLDIIKIIVWILLFYFIKGILDFLKRGVEYNLKLNDWPKKLIFHGLVKVEGNPPILFIKHSESGCLLKEYYWKNFELSFEIKYFSEEEGWERPKNVHDESFGVILRAINLDTYLMVEIYKKNNDFFVKPHIRTNGIWEAVDIKNIGQLSIDGFFPVLFKAMDQKIDLYINNGLVYSWIIPTHSQTGSKIPDTNHNELSKAKTVPSIFDKLGYGMIGFRANWFQGAYIKNIHIKTLSKLDRIVLLNRRLGF